MPPRGPYRGRLWRWRRHDAFVRGRKCRTRSGRAVALGRGSFPDRRRRRRRSAARDGILQIGDDLAQTSDLRFERAHFALMLGLELPEAGLHLPHLDFERFEFSRLRRSGRRGLGVGNARPEQSHTNDGQGKGMDVHGASPPRDDARAATCRGRSSSRNNRPARGRRSRLAREKQRWAVFEEPADEEEGLGSSNVTQWRRGGSRCGRRACHHGGDNGFVLAGVQRRRQADMVAPVGAVMNQMMQLRGGGRRKCQQQTRGRRAEQRAASKSCVTGPPMHRRYRYQDRTDS